MRRRPPELVQPASDHHRFREKQLKVPSLWDLRQADKDRASSGQATGLRPAVTGRVLTGEALTNLLAVLADLGLIDDQSSQ